jgi:hypothetical protein
MLRKKTQLNEKEMKEIFKRLDHQDKQLEQLIWSIKGNPTLGIEGVMPAVKKVEREVYDLKAWKFQEDSKRGKIDAKNIVKWVAGASTVIGCALGVIELFKYVLLK